MLNIHSMFIEIEIMRKNNIQTMIALNNISTRK